MQTKDVLFGGEPHTRTTAIGLLVLRVFAGLALALAHGWGKIPPSEGFIGMIGGMGFPAPALFAWLAAIAEFGGGLLIALGLLTRPAAVFVAAHFVIVSFVIHAGDTFGDRRVLRDGRRRPLLGGCGHPRADAPSIAEPSLKKEFLAAGVSKPSMTDS